MSARLTRGKPGGGMAMFEGWCISKVLWCATSVEIGGGDPYGNRDTGVVDVLETVEVPEDGPIGIRASEKVMNQYPS